LRAGEMLAKEDCITEKADAILESMWIFPLAVLIIFEVVADIFAKE